MNKAQLTEQLMAELSRRNIELIVSIAQNKPQVIHHLIDISLQHDEKISMRAAWALDKLAQNKPDVLATRLGDFYENLNRIPESGTRRCVLKVLMQYPVPELHESTFFDFALQMIESPKEPVAVKANCMTLIFSMLPKYPELENEVFEIIKSQLPNNSVGFKSRFKVLQRAYKRRLKQG